MELGLWFLIEGFCGISCMSFVTTISGEPVKILWISWNLRENSGSLSSFVNSICGKSGFGETSHVYFTFCILVPNWGWTMFPNTATDRASTSDAAFRWPVIQSGYIHKENHINLRNQSCPSQLVWNDFCWDRCVGIIIIHFIFLSVCISVHCTDAQSFPMLPKSRNVSE